MASWKNGKRASPITSAKLWGSPARRRAPRARRASRADSVGAVVVSGCARRERVLARVQLGGRAEFLFRQHPLESSRPAAVVAPLLGRVASALPICDRGDQRAPELFPLEAPAAAERERHPEEPAL